MITVPQPRQPSSPGEPGGSGGGRGPGRRIAVIVAVVVAVLVAAAAVGVTVLLGSGVDLVFFALGGAFLLFGVLGFVLRIFPGSTPLVPSARRILSFLSLAAFAGLLYFYAYPAITHQAAATHGLFPDPQPRYTSQPLNHDVEVVYSVTGSAPGASITMSPAGEGGQGEVTADALPFERTVTASVSNRVSATFMLVATTGGGATDVYTDLDASTIACTITVDGVVVAHQEASGAHGSAFCTGSVEPPPSAAAVPAPSR